MFLTQAFCCLRVDLYVQVHSSLKVLEYKKETCVTLSKLICNFFKMMRCSCLKVSRILKQQYVVILVNHATSWHTRTKLFLDEINRKSSDIPATTVYTAYTIIRITFDVISFILKHGTNHL